MLLNKKILWGEVVLLIFIIITASLFLPDVAFGLAISYCAVYYCIKFLYCRLNKNEILGQWAILVLALVMSAGITANIWEFTAATGGSIENPVLINPDSSRYYNYALTLYKGSALPDDFAYAGYPYLIMLLWKVTGVNIAAPLLLNMFMTLLSVVISGEISKRVLKDKFRGRSREIGGIAVLMTGMVCYYIGSGMVLLKESTIFLGFALSAYSLIIFQEKYLYNGKIIRDLLLFITGAFIVAFTRATYCYLLFIAIILFSCRYKKFRLGILFGAVILVIYFTGLKCASYGVDEHVNIIKGINMADSNYLNSAQQPYIDIIGDYLSYPFFKRIILLPLSAAIQYLIPFPWNFMRDVPFGYSLIYSHISYGWYAVGGVILFYYLFMIWKSDSKLICWSIWAFLCYLVPAYMFAGTVSRYMLPFIPLLVPAGVYVIMKLKANQYRLAFKYWICSYCIALALVLGLCYYLQVVR